MQQQQQQLPPPVEVPPPPQQPQMQQQQFYDANGNPISMPMIYDAYGNQVQFYPPPPPNQQQQMHQQPAQQVETFNSGSDPQMQQDPMQQQLMEHICPEPVTWEPPLPNNPKTSGDEPRPVGYNADTHTVSNTADVYFAQLKQDSKVRKMARMSGDLDTANTVFGDSSVREIGDSWVDNPYTKE